MLNPIKTFTCDTLGTISLNIKGAVEEALAANQSILALQIREMNNDQLFAIYGSGDQNGPALTIFQKIAPSSQSMLLGNPPENNNPAAAQSSSGPYLTVYDTVAVKDLSEPNC